MIALLLLLAAPPDVVRFTITTPSDEGMVRCAVYTSSETWLTKKLHAGAFAKIKNKKAVCVFRGLAPGTYAVSAYHDRNGNNQLDTNFIGIPSEDVCASNNAKGSFGPPKFEDAKFEYAGGLLEQALGMLSL